MANEIKWIFKKLDKKELYSEDMVDGYRSYKLVHTDEGGYTENELNFYFYSDGDIAINCYNSESGFISLYPEQVEHFKEFLALTNK
jgi:hypothetical protein